MKTKLKLTRHARIRFRQRSISENEEVLNILEFFGTVIESGNGVEKLLLTDNAVKRLTELAKKCMGKVIVVDEKHTMVLTGYHA